MATDPATAHELIGRRIVGGDILAQAGTSTRPMPSSLAG